MINPEDHVYAVVCYIIENGGRYGEPPKDYLRPFTLQNCQLDNYEIVFADPDGDDHKYGITCSVDYTDITGGHHYAEVSMSYAQILAEITDIVGTNFM